MEEKKEEQKKEEKEEKFYDIIKTPIPSITQETGIQGVKRVCKFCKSEVKHALNKDGQTINLTCTGCGRTITVPKPPTEAFVAQAPFEGGKCPDCGTLFTRKIAVSPSIGKKENKYLVAVFICPFCEKQYVVPMEREH